MFDNENSFIAFCVRCLVSSQKLVFPLKGNSSFDAFWVCKVLQVVCFAP